ncbi:MAG: response regulator transcription factor [Saprospiraceae bacterium]|nr:response regulator transcription factor [Saprospiraceae bacterium]
MVTGINAIIIDDEKFCCEMLQYELDLNCPEVRIIDICNSGKEGILSIRKNQPDLVFLDIEMPYMNGFEMLKHLDTDSFQTIFTTAYDQFALDAIKVNALDYLLKPVSGDDLSTAIAKIKSRMMANTTMHGLKKMLNEMVGNVTVEKKIALPTSEGVEMVKHNQILYIAADNNYTIFNLADGRKIMLSKHMKYIEDLLSPYMQFFRIHQSYLININYIEKYHKGSGGTVIMADQSELPVSKNKKDDLLLMLGI